MWNPFEICQIRRWIFDCNTRRLREYNVWSRMMAVIQVYCPWFCPLVRPICPHCWRFVGIVDEQSRGVYCSSDWRPQNQTAGQFPRNFHRTRQNQFEKEINPDLVFFSWSRKYFFNLVYISQHTNMRWQGLWWWTESVNHDRAKIRQRIVSLSPSNKLSYQPLDLLRQKNNTSRKQTNLSLSQLYFDVSASCNIYIWNQESRQFQNWHFLGLSPGSPVTILYRISFHQYSIQHLLLPSSLPSQQYSKVLRTSMYIVHL